MTKGEFFVNYTKRTILPKYLKIWK